MSIIGDCHVKCLQKVSPVICQWNKVTMDTEMHGNISRAYIYISNIYVDIRQKTTATYFLAKQLLTTSLDLRIEYIPK